MAIPFTQSVSFSERVSLVSLVKADTHTHTHKHRHTDTTLTCTHMHNYIKSYLKHTHISPQIHIHTLIHIYTCIYTPTYIHTHAHTHTHVEAILNVKSRVICTLRAGSYGTLDVSFVPLKTAFFTVIAPVLCISGKLCFSL